MKKLTRSFYNRDTITVAQDLLGCHLVHRIQGVERIGKIVEVEAYLGQEDLAAHSSKGITKRTSTMFGPPGHAYIYLVYGIYYCFNVVTEPEGRGTAVLFRALEPVLNVEGKTQGPGLLCKAMALDKQFNGHDLVSDDLYITDALYEKPKQIIAAPRIGVDYAKDWAHKLLRFYINDNSFVSKKIKSD